jgi:type III pantothenate kinase
MRAKAMAHFTAKLPEVEALPTQQLIGRTSQECLEIGSYLGWQKEIEGLLGAYQAKYPALVVLLTGGDAIHFDLGQKNGIFVHENLTLEGILALYYANA